VLVTWKYRPRSTFIQSLDPRSRLIFTACLILAITLIQVWDLRLLLPVFTLVLVLYLMARIEWSDVWRVWTFVILFVTFIVSLALLTARGGPESVRQAQSPAIFAVTLLTFPGANWDLTISVTIVRAFFAITQFIRMLTMALLAIPIAYTMDPSSYGVAFRQMGLADKVSYTMDLAFRFVPTLGRDFALTVDAQRARGYELETLRGGIIARLRRLAPLLVPVTMHAIVTGEEVIDAMDLRAFGVQQRTWLTQLHYRLRDYLFIAVGVVIFVAYLTLWLLGYGGFWLPDWFAALFQ
jgi:energy-coupling factor transport system permease protein